MSFVVANDFFRDGFFKHKLVLQGYEKSKIYMGCQEKETENVQFITWP